MDQITPNKTVGSSSSQPLFGLSDTQQMMFAFGDSRRPNIETSKIMENIVLSQITEIASRAVKISQLRGFKSVQLESIIFLMRKSPLKIQRLVKYLTAKEITRKATQESEGELEETVKKKSLVGRCKEFIESIDATGSLLDACNADLFDEAYVEKLLRNDKITKNMDEKRYDEYCRARVVGFRGSYSVRFQSQLDDYLARLELKLEKTVGEVLSYLAYETLGQLVELCLVMRRDSSRDSVTRLLSTRSVNTDYPSIYLPPAAGAAGAADNSKVELPGHPISPAEIREVVRRLQQTCYNDKPLARGTRHRPAQTMPLIAI